MLREGVWERAGSKNGNRWGQGIFGSKVIFNEGCRSILRAFLWYVMGLLETRMLHLTNRSDFYLDVL